MKITVVPIEINPLDSLFAVTNRELTRCNSSDEAEAVVYSLITVTVSTAMNVIQNRKIVEDLLVHAIPIMLDKIDQMNKQVEKTVRDKMN